MVQETTLVDHTVQRVDFINHTKVMACLLRLLTSMLLLLQQVDLVVLRYTDVTVRLVEDCLTMAVLDLLSLLKLHRLWELVELSVAVMMLSPVAPHTKVKIKAITMLSKQPSQALVTT